MWSDIEYSRRFLAGAHNAEGAYFIVHIATNLEHHVVEESTALSYRLDFVAFGNQGRPLDWPSPV